MVMVGKHLIAVKGYAAINIPIVNKGTVRLSRRR